MLCAGYAVPYTAVTMVLSVAGCICGTNGSCIEPNCCDDLGEPRSSERVSGKDIRNQPEHWSIWSPIASAFNLWPQNVTEQETGKQALLASSSFVAS